MTRLTAGELAELLRSTDPNKGITVEVEGKRRPVLSVDVNDVKVIIKAAEHEVPVEA